MTRVLGVALLVLALQGAAGASAREAVEPPILGADWGANATRLRTATGSRFVYVCPANGSRGQVWGTALYTDDSSVCTAAVHEGLITIADGGIVTSSTFPARPRTRARPRTGSRARTGAALRGSFQLIGADTGGGAAGVEDGRRRLDRERDELPRPERRPVQLHLPGRRHGSARSGARTSTPTTARSAPPPCRSA